MKRTIIDLPKQMTMAQLYELLGDKRLRWISK
jgi:hypothetical protein